MSVIISFPTDEGYFRRECPYCIREFKILLSEEELNDISQKIINSYMEESNEEHEEQNKDMHKKVMFFCPYCGQSAEENFWMTKAQNTYILEILKNIAFESINKSGEKLKRSLNIKPSRSSSIGVSVKYKPIKIELKKPWISPEVNDMKIFNLPSCNTSIKILKDWNDTIHCFLCGFPHKNVVE